MTSQEVRETFIHFFQKRGHAVLPSASLVPENDPSALFTTAGVQPLVPYILQGSHPQGNKLASVQKCVRTTDIDDIGDNTHATFFEMLGNWSIGEYFKEDAIKWSYELLTSKEEGFGLDPKRLYFTVYEGAGDVPRDTESAELWKQAGVPENHIYFLGDDNFWPKPKKDDTYSGPCGPSTEMFYDLEGDLNLTSKEEFLKADEEQKVVEIWNDVFMQYKKENGEIVGKLEKQNVDTGSGLERLLAVLQGKDSIFETDVFAPIMKELEGASISGSDKKYLRIIADHIRTAVFMIADGVEPSNTDRGYILRRLIRRAVRAEKKIGLNPESLSTITTLITKGYEETYPNLKDKNIFSIIDNERTKFNTTLDTGLKQLEKIEGDISGEDAFVLFSSYGFPLELTLEVAREQGKAVDVEAFEKEMKQHQEKSKSSSAGKFKGGLGGHSEQELKYHTATHLLNAALRQVLGDHVEQKGSNINPERLRFDFSHPDKLTDEQKQAITDLVNKWIQEDHAISFEEMSPEEAKAQGAIGVFGDKYGEKVKVYSIGNVSKEICGGPHVEHTNTLGTFKIKKEEASSAGVRRIKAVLN